MANFAGSGPWTWTCLGTNGAADAACSANIRTWTVTTTGSGAGGTISAPAQSPVNHGSATTFTVTTNGSYSIASVTGDTCAPSVQNGSIWTTGAITADCTITASFAVGDPPGVCGSDNGQTLISTPTNLCSSGTPTAVLGSGPWTWSCIGVTTANCSANATTGSIAVLGGGTPIVNGDSTPSTGKGTDFGNITVGTQAAHNFTINNLAAAQVPASNATKLASAAFALPNAAGDLVVSGINSSNPAFTVAGGTGTVPAGSSATFTVTFNATTVAHSEQLSCTTTDNKTIQMTNATYTGTATGDG